MLNVVIRSFTHEYIFYCGLSSPLRYFKNEMTFHEKPDIMVITSAEVILIKNREVKYTSEIDF